MKKNVLFVMPSLTAGGGEKSLINLLFQIDYNVYNVDLFLFSRTGVFINSLPKEVNLLELPSNYQIFTNGLPQAVKRFLRNGHIGLAYSRFMFTLMNRVIRNAAKSEQYTWKYQNRSLDMLDKEYDAAIGYLEKSSIYFVVDKVKSKKKIGWIHTNYSDSGMDEQFDGPYFKQLDHLVTVSEECANSLKANFWYLKNKIKIIYNIVSPRIIRHLSTRKLQEPFAYDKSYINIVTVARLSGEKGIDLAVASCRKLVDQGYRVRWHVIGDGPERESLERSIRSSRLEDHFKLLGIKENPYPFIRGADIYVQPSRYEGKSIALDEAKILQKPIVVTNYETAKDQIRSGVNGIIAEMTDDGIAGSIESLINDAALKEALIRSLNREPLGTEDEIHKLYEIFG